MHLAMINRMSAPSSSQPISDVSFKMTQLDEFGRGACVSDFDNLKSVAFAAALLVFVLEIVVTR